MEDRISFIPYEEKNEVHQNFVKSFYVDEDNLAYVPHLFKDGTMLICYEGKIVGAYSLTSAYDQNKMLEYGLLPNYRGNGIMHHALNKVLSGDVIINQIIASVSVSNTRSKNVLKKLGFGLDSCLTEMYQEEGLGEAYTLSKTIVIPNNM